MGMWPSTEPHLIEVRYPNGERDDRFTFSPKVIFREMFQLGIPASLLFGLLFGLIYVIGISRVVLGFAADPIGYLMSKDDPYIGPSNFYHPYLAIFGLWILCYIFFSVFAAVCWHYRYKHAYRIADIKPEELQALQESISHQHMTDLRLRGLTGSFVERYDPKKFFEMALIREFRTRKSLVRYVPFFRSWADIPVEGRIGSVFSQAVYAIGLALFAGWIYGQLTLILVFGPIVLASSLFSFVFVWIFDISRETRAAIALVIAYLAFAYLWTSFIATMFGDPYVSSQDIRRILQQRTKDTGEA